MTRKNIYDCLENKELDYHKEYDRLWTHFTEEIYQLTFGSSWDYLSLYQISDHYLFKHLKLGKRFLNLEDIMSELGLDDSFYNKDQDDILNFIEFIYLLYDTSLITEAPSLINVGDNKNVFNNIIEISNELLMQAGYTVVRDKKDRSVIVSQDEDRDEAIRSIDGDDSIGESLLLYENFSFKGNIKRKKEILLTIGNYVEPIIKKKGGYFNDEIGFLLNNFDIRHNNRSGKNKRDYIIKMSNEELELWYDKLYKLLIAAIICSKRNDILKDIAFFKKEKGLK